MHLFLFLLLWLCILCQGQLVHFVLGILEGTGIKKGSFDGEQLVYT